MTEQHTASGSAGVRRLTFVGRLLRWVFGPRLVWHFTIPSVLVVLLVGTAAVVVVTWYMSASLESDALKEAMLDAEWGAHMAALDLSPEQIAAPARGSQYLDLDHIVQAHIKRPGVVRVKIWSPSGQIIYSDEPALVGQTFPVGERLAKALAGESVAQVTDSDAEENKYEIEYGRLVEIYTPIRLENSPEVVAVLEVYEDYGRVAGRVGRSERTIYAAAAAVAAIYVVLFIIHRRGAAIIARQSEKLIRQAEELKQSYHETLATLARALDHRDHATEDHGRRVSDLATTVAREMGLSGEEIEQIGQAAVVHDIGKMTLPDVILSKPGPLTEEEWREMRRHPLLGYEMLKDIPVLGEVAEIVHSHHERYDGTGYPRGLRGDEIPLGARIFAVVDAYDAITSDRPYRKAASHEEAMMEIARRAGTQFDPDVVRAFREAEKKGLVGVRPRQPGGDGKHPEAPEPVAEVPQE